MLREETADQIRYVVLTGTRGNSLDANNLRALDEAFDPARRERGAVVLTAEGRSFCTGLDLVSAFELDRDGMRELMRLFHRALAGVLLWPGPVVAAVQGHALAGGALLALCAARRVMAHGDFRFGIHGVRIGVTYPQVAIEALRWRFARALVEELLYHGALRNGVDALKMGLVDRLVEEGDLLPAAAELAREQPAEAERESMLEPLRANLETLDRAGEEAWLDHWFAPGTRERVAEARLALIERRGPRPGEH